jgi:hypothetical protein
MLKDTNNNSRIAKLYLAQTFVKITNYFVVGRNVPSLYEIFGPVQENTVWRSRTDGKMINLYRETHVTSGNTQGRLRWLGQVERMTDK